MKKTLALVCTLCMLLSFVACTAESNAPENDTGTNEVAANDSNLVSTIINAPTTQAFSDDPVSDEDLNQILRAGLSATSAINQQPWYFAAVTSQEVMDEIAGSMSFGGAPTGGTPPDGAEMPEGFEAEDMPEGAEIPEGFDPPNMPEGVATGTSAKAAVGDSPVAIIIYMDENISSNASFDCGLACQNMVIAANSLGYGTKILSSPTMALNGENHDTLCELLGVDTALNAVAVLLIGYPDTEVDGVTGASTRDSLDDKVSFVN